MMSWLNGASIFTCASLLLACGAPTKKASEVSSIFGAPSSLQDKMDRSCSALFDGKNEQLADVSFDLSSCTDAGLSAINYDEAAKFYITGIEKAAQAEDGEVIPLRLRSQVWMNKTLIELAAPFISRINGRVDGQSQLGDLLSNTNHFEDSDIPEKLIRLEVEDLGGEFRLEKGFYLTQDLRLRAEGVVQLGLDLRLSANTAAGNLSFVLTTLGASKDSFVRNIELLVFVVGHAQDTYLDFMINVEIANIGYGDQIEDATVTLIETQMKTIVDTLLHAEEAM